MLSVTVLSYITTVITNTVVNSQFDMKKIKTCLLSHLDMPESSDPMATSFAVLEKSICLTSVESDDWTG